MGSILHPLVPSLVESLESVIKRHDYCETGGRFLCSDHPRPTGGTRSAGPAGRRGTLPNQRAFYRSIKAASGGEWDRPAGPRVRLADPGVGIERDAATALIPPANEAHGS